MKIGKEAGVKFSKNQKGSILLIVLMIMMIITLTGLVSMNLTITDLKISQNDRCFKQNLFMAEAAAFEAGQIFETDTSDGENLKPETTNFTWLGDGAGFDPVTDEWQYTGTQNASSSVVYHEEESGYTAVFEGVASGASLDMSSDTQLWEYSVYGRSEKCGGRVDIVMGYRKRY